MIVTPAEIAALQVSYKQNFQTAFTATHPEADFKACPLTAFRLRCPQFVSSNMKQRKVGSKSTDIVALNGRLHDPGCIAA